MRCLVAAALAAIALAASSVLPRTTADAQLTKERAIAIFLQYDKVADWLDRYSPQGRTTDATYEAEIAKCAPGATGGCWEVHVSKPRAGEIAKGKVDDRRRVVTEAWTGPQVAWTMARGQRGSRH